jgi:SHS2 domain-containing protein
MQKKFEIIDHTADIGITAYGSDLGELMSNAAGGMVSLIMDPRKIEKKLSRTIELQAADGAALLVRWLNELIYELEVERLIFAEFSLVTEGATKLKAVCWGERIDRERHKLKREIKAATYHNLHILKEKDVYSASVIFDI